MTVDCPECDRSFDGKQGASIHYSSAHDGKLGKSETQCSGCGAELQRFDYILENHDDHFCSNSCRWEVMSETMKGEKSPNWTGKNAPNWQGGDSDDC
jgi:endogenous inhibitor of DNA gyrase (YacG/DUF329 family)